MTYKQVTEEELLAKLSEKLGIPIEEIKAEFEAAIQETKGLALYKNATDEQIRSVARGRFSMRKQRELLSNAIPWEGAIIGIGDLIDTVATQKRVTEAAFKAD